MTSELYLVAKNGCGPCQRAKKFLSNIGVDYVEISPSETTHEITMVPTLIWVRDGKEPVVVEDSESLEFKLVSIFHKNYDMLKDLD